MPSDKPDWALGREVRTHEIKTQLQRAGVSERAAAKEAERIATNATKRAIHDHERKR